MEPVWLAAASTLLVLAALTAFLVRRRSRVH
jgi:heme exporter protein D